jgi:hypothetical protein
MNTEVACRFTSLVAEVLAYTTLAAYGILIARTLGGRGPGVYLFMTTLTPLAILITKVPVVVGLLAKHVTMSTALPILASMSISWTLQAMFMGQSPSNVPTKVALCAANMALMLYFIMSTSRFSRAKLYEKCKAGKF